ncbi:MAG: hypothetical protein ABI625_17475 [bacterium]
MRLSHTLSAVLVAATFVAMGPVDNQAMAASVRAGVPSATHDVRSAESPAARMAIGHVSGVRASMSRKSSTCSEILTAIYNGTQQLNADRSAQEAAHMLEGLEVVTLLEFDPWAAYVVSGYYEVVIQMDLTNLNILATWSNSYGCV